MTLRHNSRLHHIGLGRKLIGMSARIADPEIEKQWQPISDLGMRLAQKRPGDARVGAERLRVLVPELMGTVRRKA